MAEGKIQMEDNIVERSISKLIHINKKYIYYAAAFGLLLVGISNAFNTDKQEKSIDVQHMTISQYCESEELRLEDILSHIEGVGKVHVMMTLQNGIEYRYAADEKQSEDSVFTYASGTESPSKVEQTENSEQNYILVGGTGDKKPLVVTELSPSVKGVVVVCSGASDAVIRQRVTEAVTTAMGINSLQVCVIQASN